MLDILTTPKTVIKENNNEYVKSLKDMLLDSFVIGIITSLSLWSGQKITLEECLPLLKVFVLSFAVQLAYYRGIKRAD